MQDLLSVGEALLLYVLVLPRRLQLLWTAAEQVDLSKLVGLDQVIGDLSMNVEREALVVLATSLGLVSCQVVLELLTVDELLKYSIFFILIVLSLFIEFLLLVDYTHAVKELKAFPCGFELISVAAPRQI